MENKKDTNITIPFLTKFIYGMGDFGNNFNWTLVSSFLMYFYTDVFGVSMGAVSLLMLLSRGWDAINDPIIGSLADKTKSKWGRYRPWVLFSAFPASILLILCFTAFPQMGSMAKIVYMFITYMLLVFFYTGVNIPYGTLAGSMTQNTDERAGLSIARIACANVAMGVIGMIVMPLVGVFGRGNEAAGFQRVAFLFVAIFICTCVAVFTRCKEVVEPPQKVKYPLGLQLKSVFTNPPVLIAFVGQLIWGFYIYGRGAVVVYYFKYVAGNENLMVPYNMVGIIPIVLGTLAFGWLYKRIPNKGRITSYSCFAGGITLILMAFTSPLSSPVLFFGCQGLFQFCSGLLATGAFGIIPDTAEYVQYRNGIRNDGFVYAFISLGHKFGLALGTAGVALVLELLGYQANTAMSPAILNTFNLFLTAIPGVLAIVMGIVFLFYKIDRTMFNNIMSNLSEQKD